VGCIVRLLCAGAFAGQCFAAWAETPTACDGATGTAMEVGPGKTYVAPSVAAAVAKDGAVIRIAAGDYRGDVAVWTANRLTICGVGGRPGEQPDRRCRRPAGRG